ncbi:hypothetical protein BKA70DRAFT_360505 [Coprinopsis sp. MPI-PUGE-AT-0042]|nr:hypothetical protein BKA70DRAFT_360505 [Coprinopsis sp. MPI-PUGE-AT-0042]
MASELPSELVREIVGYFSRASDMGTLQAASLVSSVFRTPCQEEIFSSVHVYKQHSEKNDTAHHLAGLKILRQNRTLLSYIKAVSVKQSPDGFLLLPDKNLVESATTELILIIATPAVQKFSFIGWEGETTPEFQSGILTLVRSPHLVSLSLTYAPVQLADMVGSPHLQHLEVRLAAYYQSNPPEKQLFLVPFQSTVTQRKRPTSLALTPDGATISLLLGNSSSFDLDAVKELELGSPCHTRGSILLLIQRCGPSLRRLRVATDGLIYLTP